MQGISVYPDAQFIKKYRREIEDYFLTDGNHLQSVLRQLENMNYGNILNMDRPEDMDTDDEDEMDFILINLKQKPLSQTLINVYLRELASTGLALAEMVETNFPAPVTINLRESTQKAEINLYPYQTDARIAMRDYFLKEGGQSGILQMPTGSGKTLTAVYFLL